MFKQLVSSTSAALLCCLMTAVGYGQLDGLYEFDAGGNGTTWDDPANWAEILDPNGNPLGGGDPATPPSATTSADVPLLGLLVVDGTQAGQTALDVNVGTDNGAGSLIISGGDLTTRDVFVGSDSAGINIGLLAMSGGTLVAGDDITLGNGSVGIMTMSGGDASTGDDFVINANSSLIVNGGSLTVGDRLVTEVNAGVVVNGGSVLADDDFFFFGNSQIVVNGGSMTVFDKMRFDDDESNSSKLTINGGFVRSNEFHFDITDITDFRGEVEINGDGFYQVEQGDGSTQSSLTVEMAQALVDEGVHFTTSETGPAVGLVVSTVIVPEFDGRFDVTFTQISVGLIPEPATLLLLGVGILGLALQRRRV